MELDRERIEREICASSHCQCN